MNRNIDVSSTVLYREINLCQEALTTVETLKGILEKSKQQAENNGWHDNNYKKAARTVDNCIKTLEEDAVDNISVLLKNLNEVLRVVLEYEKYGNSR